LKERLVGAAVLMAAAVILIPEMLSGPRRASVRAPAPSPAAAPQQSEGNLKRYSIDLNGTQPPAPLPQAATVVEEPAPPPEELPQDDVEPAGVIATTPLAQPLVPDVSAESASAQSSPAVQVPPSVAIEQNQPSPAMAPAEPASAAVEPAPSNTRRWAVQIMATASREDAQREAEDLRNGNYAAFVMPVQSGRATLYRVRVGPFTQRTQAEDALRKLRSVRSNPIVVAQP
jgi:DedD protein